MALTSEEEARHLRKLAALVMMRRTALKISSKAKAADLCDIADFTYRKIEKGQPVSDETYAKVDVGFRFRANSCRAVATGEADSITLEDGTELIEGGAIRDFVNSKELRDDFDRTFDRSAALNAPDITLSKSKAIKEDMYEVLRKHGILDPE